MARRLFVLLVPFALAVAACSSDSPAVSPDTTSTSESTTTTAPSTTQPTSGISTTTPPGEGVAMTGPGSGRFTFSVAPERSELCYRITVSDVPKATEAHLHRQIGEVVLNLTPPDASGTVNTCSAADSILIEEIQSSPGDFYLDVHTSAGILRAELR
jgi:hypothetical protein